MDNVPNFQPHPASNLAMYSEILTLYQSLCQPQIKNMMEKGEMMSDMPSTSSMSLMGEARAASNSSDSSNDVVCTGMSVRINRKWEEK